MIDRRRARILAMQALCQLDAQGDAYLEAALAFVSEGEIDAEAGEPRTAGVPREPDGDASVDPQTTRYARELVESAWRQRARIDAGIGKVATGWSVGRQAAVDRNVIRTAAVELDAQAIPVKIIINEAIEIGREYGSAASPAFINGVLDALCRERRAKA